MAGPPPPPPLPGIGRNGGGPPAPPPPPPGSTRPPNNKGRGALLSSIENGTRLKRVQVNDRSAPQIETSSSSRPARPTGAPPVPGMGMPPRPPASGGLAPPIPGGSRLRSNSDGGEGGGPQGAPPQLAGILAGGIPKLRKVGGIDTGADNHAPYLSDPETSRAHIPPAPRVPGAPPRPPGAAPSAPSVGQLRNNLRPSSVVSTSSTGSTTPRSRVPPPVGKKPPIPPPSSRKPSIGLPLSVPSAPPVPVGAPRPSPGRASAPLPPQNGPTGPSLAEQAARNAFNRSSAPSIPPPRRDTHHDDDYDPYNYSTTSSPPRLPPSAPSAPPPRPGASAPPPPPAAPPSTPPTPPPPPASAPRPSYGGQSTPLRSMLDVEESPPAQPPRRPVPSSTSSSRAPTIVSNGNRSSSMTMSTTRTNSSFIDAPRPPARIHDSRWQFQDDDQLPKPRAPINTPKKYRAGRVSSVPLDMAAFE